MFDVKPSSEGSPGPVTASVAPRSRPSSRTGLGPCRGSSAGLVGPGRSVGVVHSRPAFERLHRVALERCWQAGAEEPGAGHGGVTVAAPDRIGRLGRASAPVATIGPRVRPEHPELLALAEVAGRHAEQADLEPADLGPGELERNPPDRFGEVRRVDEGPLAGDGPKARVADLDGDRAAFSPADRNRDATPSAMPSSVRSITSGSDVSTSNVCSWPIDFAASASPTGSGSTPRARSRARRRASRTGGREGPPGARRGRRS